MKIFLIKKNYIIFILSIIFLLLTFIFIIQKPFSIAIELSSNSELSEDIKEEISSISKKEEKIAYLTFDDGPTVKATSKILDILQKYNIKATFFVIGKYVENHPELVKRAYEEGHFIANHGYSHNNSLLYKSSESFINEVKSTDAAIANAIGVEDYCSHIFRFPNGYMSANNKTKKKEAVKFLSQMNYTYVDWNCLNNDSVKKYSNAQLLNNLKKSAKNKGTLIVLMHDTNDVNNTTDILEDSILYLKSEGYQFKNFYDLVNTESTL